MVQKAEILPSSPTLQASLEVIRQTILPKILRYNGVRDDFGQQETVLDHVNGMKKLSAHIRQRYPHLASVINFNEVDIMADLHDSGEANLYGDLSRGRRDYNALRARYDEYERVYKEDYVFPLFAPEDREYVERLDFRFEHREKLEDREGLMSRILDKAQPLDIYDKGFIVNTLRSFPQNRNLSEKEFDVVVRQNIIEGCVHMLEPGKKLFDLLASQPKAQQELLSFMNRDILLPMIERGYGNEVAKAKEKVFGETKRKGTRMRLFRFLNIHA